jgi:hypothetical protein
LVKWGANSPRIGRQNSNSATVATPSSGSCAGTAGRPLLQSFAQRLRRPQKSCGSPWRSITALSEEGEGDAHPCGRSEASRSVRSCHNHVRREHPLSDEEVVPLATNRFAICCLIRLGRVACCCNRINSSLVQDASCDHQPEHDRSSGDLTRPANARGITGPAPGPEGASRINADALASADLGITIKLFEPINAGRDLEHLVRPVARLVEEDRE